MRWPWQKRERRDSGGDFNDAVLRAIEAQAAGQAADASSTAAVEAASGALSRAFAGAKVVGAPWAQECVSTGFLAQCGRDLIRRGDSLHVIRMSRSGAVRLIPCSSWHWEGNHDPESWTVRATAYGPSTSTTWNLPANGVVFLRWGSNPGQPYVGVGPTDWAATTARLNAATQKSLADEAGGPVAQILPIPADGGDGEDDDPLATLKTDIAAAKGKAVLTETTAAGWGDGRTAAPQKDWSANRLGPSPPDAMVKIAEQSFMHVLAACGTPPSLFTDADGTSQRESARRWHMGTVMPLVRMIETELTAKLETPVKLELDGYPKDMVSRAQVFRETRRTRGSQRSTGNDHCRAD